MSPRGRFVAWLSLLYGAVLAVAAIALAAQPRAPLLALFALLLLLACAGAVKWFLSRYVTPARALAQQTRVIAGPNPALRIAAGGTREFAELASAINALGTAYGTLKRDSEARANETRLRLEEERNRLAALMSELSQGVLVCNPDGAILLYNEQARALFAASETPGLVGLGRSVFALLDRGQLAHAKQRLEYSLERGEPRSSVRFVAPTAGGRLLKAQVAPFLDAAAQLAGLVITLEDVTTLLERESQRRSLLQTFAARIRAPAANIRAAAENLAAYAEIEPRRREQFIGIVAEESRTLSRTIDEALREYADALKAALTLEDMRASELLEFARQRIESTLGVACQVVDVEQGCWVLVDSYAFVQAMVHLAGRLKEDYGVRLLELCARGAGRFAEIDLAWSGAIVSSDALSLWEAEAIQAGAERSPLTVREVLEQHGGEVWYQRSGVAGQRRGCFRFLVTAAAPVAVSAPARRIAQSRPEYYDFDLFGAGQAAHALHDAPLATLKYTAFDTETTGLQPSAGDEIISVGAVRIVNGRLLRNEIFEQLVDPRRPLNPDSARVHGIDLAALKGQPTIAQVLPLFHRFCEDTVLVGHNAAFDMRFLQLKQPSTGVRFKQPVLDTLLLSAAAHPNLDDHRLEAIAERLGVQVMGRHTAVGDALLTGEIFLKLLPLLAERGVRTLGQALSVSRETYYARLQY